MKIIYKYQIPLTYLNNPNGYDIEINDNYRILTAKIQNNDYSIWAIVDTDEALVLKTFYLFGTGIVGLDFDYKTHISTDEEYGLVYHLFEKYEPTQWR